MSNITFKWLTKEDFTSYAQITLNIEDRFIEIAVNRSYTSDMAPVLSDSMLSAIRAVLLVNPINWNRSTNYVLNDKVFYDGVYYRCLIANSDSIPTSSNTNWVEIALMTFWTDFVKPYFVMSAYAKLILWHGVNITQFGARQINEETSTEITDKRRGEILEDIRGDINIYLSKLNKEFDRVSGVFDGVTYTKDSADNDTPTRGGAEIWGVGYPNTKRVKCPNEYPNGCQ